MHCPDADSGVEAAARPVRMHSSTQVEAIESSRAGALDHAHANLDERQDWGAPAEAG